MIIVKMKILLIGDVHYKRDNTSQTQDFQNQVYSLIPQVEHIIFLGDVLDSHAMVNIQILARFCNFVNGIDIPITILVGNHDMTSNRVCCDPMENWMSLPGFGFTKPNINVVYQPTKFCFGDGQKFLAMPYLYPDDWSKILEAVDLTNVKFVVAHQEFKGCKMGSIESIGGSIYDLDVPCFSGHIHETQRVGQVLYTGSAFPHSWSSPPCFLWILDTDTMALEQIKSVVKNKPEYTVTFTDELIDSLPIVENVESRLIIHVNNEDEIKRCMNSKKFTEYLSKNVLLSVVFKYPNQVQEDDSSGTIIDKYRKTCRDNHLDPLL